MSHQSISLVKNLNRIRPVTVIHSNVTNAVQQVMEAIHAPVYFETYDIKGNMSHFPQEVLDSIRKNKVCLNGTSLCCGEELDLFASLVNCFNLNGQPSRHKNVNVVVIRENNHDKYKEHQVVPGVVESFQVTMTKFWSDRIAKYAFEFAKLNKRKKVTAVVHNKGMKLADAIFLESCQEAATVYPPPPIITYEEISVSSCCLQLVEKPHRFDNLYGNLIANIAAGVAGGGGNGDNVMPGGSFGREYAVFEQVGSVRNNENPVALMFSSVMMLRHLQLLSFANRLETALKRFISEAKCGNSNSTTTTTQEVVDFKIF